MRGAGAARPLSRPGADALIFDLDGTLWDAAAASTHGWNLALEEMGVPLRVTVAGIRSVSGLPFTQCVANLLPELQPLPDATVRSLETHERLGIETRGGVLYDGVAEGLPLLASAYPLFVVSNCPEWYLLAFLEATGLRECFRGWDSHGASGMDKARMLQDVQEKYDLVQAIYVGDTERDREAAEEAGLEFAFVTYGFGQTDAPSLCFDSFDELVEHFLG